MTIRGLAAELKPRQTLTAAITFADGSVKQVSLLCRIDTLDELDYFKNGGILAYVLRRLAAESGCDHAWFHREVTGRGAAFRSIALQGFLRSVLHAHGPSASGSS